MQSSKLHRTSCLEVENLIHFRFYFPFVDSYCTEFLAEPALGESIDFVSQSLCFYIKYSFHCSSPATATISGFTFAINSYLY